jgi:hypothetical protein
VACKKNETYLIFFFRNRRFKRRDVNCGNTENYLRREDDTTYMFVYFCMYVYTCVCTDMYVPVYEYVSVFCVCPPQHKCLYGLFPMYIILSVTASTYNSYICLNNSVFCEHPIRLSTVVCHNL